MTIFDDLIFSYSRVAGSGKTAVVLYKVTLEEMLANSAEGMLIERES